MYLRCEQSTVVFGTFLCVTVTFPGWNMCSYAPSVWKGMTVTLPLKAAAAFNTSATRHDCGEAMGGEACCSGTQAYVYIRRDRVGVGLGRVTVYGDVRYNWVPMVVVQYVRVGRYNS